MNLRNLFDSVISSKSKKAQIIRYVITGGFATFLQYAFYLLLVNLTSFAAYVATPVSYLVSLIFNFVLSNLFTFHTKPTKKKALAFVASHMINLGLQTVLVGFFSHLLNKNLALLPAMGICIPVNFILVRFSLTSKWTQ